MTQTDPEASPEYHRARMELEAYWKRIRDGRQKGITDDPAVAIAGLMQRFGPIAIEAAVQEYIENLPSSFDRRWREYHAGIEEANQRARNPRRAGRKHRRSDNVLMAAWLIVNKCMRTKGLTARDACKILGRSPTRRGAAQWPGLLLYRDYTSTGARPNSYYVKTPENLRDIYLDAKKRHRDGPEGLRQQWQWILEVMAPSREVKSTRL
ncbi:MAG TPA: hypothetical protein VLX09_25370 [Stellaceae bacterium]|nr:hypothetical protein [Stellaceae bacterium]